MNEPTYKVKTMNTIFKQNYPLKQFIPFWMAYFYCFSLGENLDLPDFLQKSFITSTTRVHHKLVRELYSIKYATFITELFDLYLSIRPELLSSPFELCMKNENQLNIQREKALILICLDPSLICLSSELLHHGVLWLKRMYILLLMYILLRSHWLVR